ncbi:MAG: PQQ-dependent sugar dehydrogenase [Gammaproteobacteria bacterium]|nr:PQQ-dependent sugar dehydrogenase [Gammaproteobacteria bacterium]
MTIRRRIVTAALLLGTTPGFALAADANAGKEVFRQQCALCHSAEQNDGGGAQGPLLHGVFGRKAAGSDGFNYTDALRNSGLIWDAATLDRFLTSPTTVVPGSAMVIPITDSDERQNVVAYFEALKNGTFKEAPRRPGFGPPPGDPPPPPPGEGEWKQDAPGRMHRVDLAALPEPFVTPSAFNFPRVVPKPADAKLSVPAGFKVETFASEGLSGPREMKVAPNGDIFLAETNAGRIQVLRMSADGKLAGSDVFAQGLMQPYGMAFYPAANPQWLYVAEMNRIVRYAYQPGQRVAAAVPEVVVQQLSPRGGGHFTRDLQFSRDGKMMYVSVGSLGNVADGANDLPAKSAAEIAAWEAARGLGAAWGVEENRAAVLAFEVGSSNPPKLYATGIRNCVSLTRQPGSDQLWCTTNERDALGDNLVPDYSTRVMPGRFYGWPWYYMGDHEDPRHAGARPDLKGKITVPDVPYTAHSAATNLDFYEAGNGSSAFPAEYVGEGLAVLHGSWNRGHRTGHKVVRVKMKDGVPTGEYQDFLTGFIVDDAGAWGRPVALAQMPDGSLLLADDGTNTIYRISYSR